jgi:hypothetical protein
MMRFPPSAAGRKLEWELLLLCTRTMVASGPQHQIRPDAAGELDWNFLIETAHHHKVLPLVFRSLDPASIPQAPVLRLKRAVAANIKRNLFLTRELLRVLEQFARSGISVIPYKGPVLASLLYGDPGLREFSDLDVLIPANEVARARTLLISEGYRPDVEMTEQELQSFIRREKDMTLLREDLGIDLEVHWRITAEHDAVRVPSEFLWQRVRPYAFAGQSVQVLDPEALLVVLCIHGARHLWEKLAWLGDIAAIIHRPLNWDRVIDDVRSLDCERILALGLSLARDLLGAELPPRAMALIDTDPGLQPLANEVKSHLFSNATLAPHTGQAMRFSIRLRTRHRDRLRIAINHMRRYAAPTSRDEEALPLPASLRWILYLLRPFRVAREYGLTPIRRVWRGLFL